MNYSIYKDDNVSSTVKRIKRILDCIGIETEEVNFSFPTIQNNELSRADLVPYSSRVSFFDMMEIGTNGKGTSEDNCRASAYSEFMERLQNQSLPNNFLHLDSARFFFAPDEKEYDKETEDFMKKYGYTKSFSVLSPERICIPYFNVKDKKLHYLPLFSLVQGSNGMAAGNTPEEALVQGFSEVCERYSHAQVILNKISMPDIPKEYYENYETIMGLVHYAEEFGWSVHIKDASLGKNLPVVCAVFEHQKEGVFSYVFGSQPSLLVAIERTLTEFFQGAKYRGDDTKDHIFHMKKNLSNEELRDAIAILYHEKWFFEKSEKMYDIFFNEKSDYNFSPSSWVDTDKQYTNKELLKFIVEKTEKVTDNGIYVRDVSFLRFPAYHIFIPEMSESIDFSDNRLNLCKWIIYADGNRDLPGDIDSLISAILYDYKYPYLKGYFVPPMPDEYILLLCYIVKDDVENILKYCNIIKNINDSDFIAKNKNLIDIIQEYFELKQKNETQIEIEKQLVQKYDMGTFQKFQTLLNILDLDYIAGMLRNSRAQRCGNNCKKTQEQIDMDNKINEIKQDLIQKYIENTPNQKDLAKVFDFTDVDI